MRVKSARVVPMGSGELSIMAIQRTITSAILKMASRVDSGLKLVEKDVLLAKASSTTNL